MSFFSHKIDILQEGGTQVPIRCASCPTSFLDYLDAANTPTPTLKVFLDPNIVKLGHTVVVYGTWDDGIGKEHNSVIIAHACVTVTEDNIAGTLLVPCESSSSVARRLGYRKRGGRFPFIRKYLGVCAYSVDGSMAYTLEIRL